MSRSANCLDNAVAVSFFHTLKTELVYHEHYRTLLGKIDERTGEITGV